MPLSIIQVDAFTDKPFHGNPAAVCLLTEPPREAWLQQVAREMNLSETAFLLKQGDGYSLRWFTPTVEVDLCGHATLACAHVLWEAGHLRPDQTARFYTKSGSLTAARKGDWIEMDFPAEPVSQTAFPTMLARALGVSMKYVGVNRLDYLVHVDGEASVRELKPDFGLIGSLGKRGVIVTAASDTRPYDFVSRYFAPQAGILEDPVTGSAHCALGPYWSDYLDRRDELTGFQASARGGVVKVRVDGERVRLSGQAVTVLRGELV